MIDKEALEKELRASFEKEGWYQIPLAILGAYGALTEGGQAYNDIKKGNYGYGALHAGLAALSVVSAPFSKALTWLPKLMNARKLLAAGSKIAPEMVTAAEKIPWYSKLNGYGSIKRAENLASMQNTLPQGHALTDALTTYGQHNDAFQTFEHSSPFKYEHKLDRLGMLPQTALVMGPQFLPGFYPSESAEQGMASAEPSPDNVPTNNPSPVPTRKPQVPTGNPSPVPTRKPQVPTGNPSMYQAFKAPTYAEYQNYLKNQYRD